MYTVWLAHFSTVEICYWQAYNYAGEQAISHVHWSAYLCARSYFDRGPTRASQWSQNMKRFFSLIAQLVILGIIFILVLSMLSPFLPFIFQLLLLGLIILLIWALLSPFESLGWWAGWSDRSAS